MPSASRSSSGCASIAGAKGAGSTASGRSPRPSTQANSSTVGRGEAVPDLLDVVGGATADLGHRRLGEAGGDADAQRTGDELQQRPAAGLVEPVEPSGDEGRQAEFADRGEAEHDGGQGRRLAILVGRRGRRPQQRHRLGEVADVVVGEIETGRDRRAWRSAPG